jgi:hypothetical protein
MTAQPPHGDPLTAHIGEAVDRLITLDVLAYGVITPLYEAARREQGGPLALQAAGSLVDRLAAGGCALITTGLILPGHHPYGETDGPIGSAVLARALALGLGIRVLVVTEPELCPLVGALLRQAELQVVGASTLAAESGRHRPVAAVVPQSRDSDEAKAEAKELLAGFKPGAAIAVERCGANAKGVYHMVGGADISASVGKATALFEAARREAVLTIGIGDRGNELGFGPLADTVRALLPFGRDCGCPCHGGVADQTPADLCLPATVSNWGAYGIAACLAALLERPDLIQSPELERELLDRAVQAGGVDGMSGRARASVDGIDASVHAALVTLLREIYQATSARNPSPFSTPLIRARLQAG